VAACGGLPERMKTSAAAKLLKIRAPEIVFRTTTTPIHADKKTVLRG
jgi:hypothetical protein